MVPRVVPAGSAAGTGLALVHSGPGETPGRMRGLQPLPASLPGGDDPIPGVPWRKAECVLCMNCVGDCPEHGIQFRFFPLAPGVATMEGADLKRRRVLTGLAAGAAAVPLLRANTGLGAEPHERLIRPPAALDEKPFLARCIRCGECMKVCPNNALHPAFTEAGWEGIWTPVLVRAWDIASPIAPLRPGMPDRRDRGVYVQGEGLDRSAVRGGLRGALRAPGGERADPCRHRLLRPGPMSALGDGHRLHGVRGVVPHFAQGRLPAVGRGDRCRREHPAGPAALHRSRALRRLWRVRVCLPGAGPPGGLCHQRWESRSKTNRLLLGRAAKPVSWFPRAAMCPDDEGGRDRSFEAADLWKYVDGDAERYLRRASGAP